jgi:thiol-disulfide isomerase/thioredoxin
MTAALAAALLACRSAPVERPDGPDRAAAPDPQALARMADEARDLLLEGRLEAARARLDVHLATAPADARLRWLAAAAALADGDPQALALHRAALPGGSGWALLLHARERAGLVPRRETSQRIAEARARLGDHPDAVWQHAMALAMESDENGLAALAAVPGLPDSVRDFIQARLVGNAFFALGAAPPPIRPSLEQVQALVAHAERTAPTGTLAVARAIDGWLGHQRADLALELAERALARRPDALPLLVQRAQARVRQDPAQRDPAIAELVALAGSRRADPDALAELAAALSSLGATEAAQAIELDVRRRFPDARAVERWDHREAAVFRAVVPCRLAQGTGKPVPAEELARQRAPVDALFDRPRTRDASLRGATTAALVEFLDCEPQAPLQRLEAVARALLVTPYGMAYDAQAAVLLTNRGGDRELARTLAERAVALAREVPPEFPLIVPPSELEQYRRAAEALAHHARGLVHLRANRDAEARTDIARAHELWPTSPDIALLAAELAERDGQPRRAEQHLARAIVAGGAHAAACRDRLLALVRARGGTEAELDRTIARLEREWQDERIAAVLARRPASPKPVPPFEFDLRGGGKIAGDALRGRVTVVIATEPWCAGCRAEAPELAKLQARYRGRKDVQFLVVTGDPDGIAALHEGAGFRAPIARDDGWSSKVGINSLPTHLFIDAAGREVARETGGHSEMSFTYPALIDAARRGR